KDAGEGSGGVLAHTVPDQGSRLDAPGHQEPCESVLDDKDGGKLDRGPVELGGRCGRAGFASKEQVADVGNHCRWEARKTAVNIVAEHRLVSVEVKGHST